MDWPFERGRSYNRRADIHQRYSGQRQGGIITPKNVPVVILITGSSGAQHGYSDHLREDGVFEYFGEGQIGDMKLKSGNRAIARHSELGRSLLLFTKQKNKMLRYEGEWTCAGIQERQAKDKIGRDRLAFVFELELLDTLNQYAASVEVAQGADLKELRAEAIAASKALVPGQAAARTIFQRSQAVKRYVLARAGQTCEGCSADAPFERDDGSPYLEPHHIRRLSDGGPDDPRFVIALCPNCHRHAHHGRDRANFNHELRIRLSQIEAT